MNFFENYYFDGVGHMGGRQGTGDMEPISSKPPEPGTGDGRIERNGTVKFNRTRTVTMRLLNHLPHFKIEAAKGNLQKYIEINNKRPPPLPKWIDSHVINKSVPYTHNQDRR